MIDTLEIMGLRRPDASPWLIEVADEDGVAAHRRLRRAVFCDEQGLFGASDADDDDDDPRTVVLVARQGAEVVGGVRLAPRCTPDIGWWSGSRLAVAAGARSAAVGAGLVRAACAYAEAAGALRFEAAVQARREPFFVRLGWDTVGCSRIAGHDHVLMRWPVGRVQSLVDATKAPLGALVAGLAPPGWVGDDGAPVPGSDLVAACDAVVPSMVERDPEWAGWCSVLVNVNDLTAMGATPVGLLDAIGAPSASFAGRVLRGFVDAAARWGVPVLGGHTTLGVHASMAVTALGRAPRPVPAGGGRPGHEITLTADLDGGWRPGYQGRQWDSTSGRDPSVLRDLSSVVAAAAPAAAKDVSMAGVVGTLGMLAESSGCGAVLDVARVPRPHGATIGDWLTCFPGYAMLTADRPGRAVAAPVSSAPCGSLRAGSGVALRWPDGVETVAVAAGVTGLGAA